MTWKGEEDKNFDLNFFKRDWRYYLAIEAFSRKRWFGGGEAKNELKSNIAQWEKKLWAQITDLVEKTWSNYLFSKCFCFLICKMEIMSKVAIELGKIKHL